MRWFSSETDKAKDLLEVAIQNEIMKDSEEFLPKKKDGSSKLADVHKFNIKDVDTYDEGEKDLT